MPTRPLRACPGCGVAVKEGRCSSCMAKRYRQQDDRRGSSSARGYGRSWQRIRAAHLQLEPLCRFCLARGCTTAATEVDHIDGDSSNNNPANLRSLCKPDHSRRTMRDQVPR